MFKSSKICESFSRFRARLLPSPRDALSTAAASVHLASEEARSGALGSPRSPSAHHLQETRPPNAFAATSSPPNMVDGINIPRYTSASGTSCDRSHIQNLAKPASSFLKKLAEKDMWDLAELKTKKDKRLLNYLVNLALEAGYTEKVNELCERYSLEGFAKASDDALTEDASKYHYLDLKSLSLEDIIWVDEVNGLLAATDYIEGCKIIGMDCEWKPNYVKGAKPNKVSIMQIASENRAYIFDLMKLYGDEQEMLDNCLRRILCSSNTLKLGYSLRSDLHQLSHSYGDLECFKSYEMLLDVQKLFEERNGGLSGLAKKILGAGLNKTVRNSNWEQRPLSQKQKEYAALDAAVLVHIFRHIRGHPQSGDAQGQYNVDWKSHIVSGMTKTRRTKAS